MKQVFISYRQTDDEQKRRVRAFGERLRQCGIDVLLDQFFLDANPGGPDWAKWSSDNADEIEHVLIVGTREWFQCFDQKQPPGTGLGAAYEARIIRQRIYDAGGLIDNIRIILFDHAEAAHIPAELRSYHRFHAEHDFADIVRWLGGTLPRKRAAKVNALRAQAVSLRGRKSWKLLKKDNPFHPVGTLPHDHKTYIRRASDHELERLITGADRLIAIIGEFRIGKSSLMEQTRRILTECQFFSRGLADLEGHDQGLFMENFFGLFATQFGSMSRWDELENHLSGCPSVLFLDEVGEVASAGLRALVPGLVARLTETDINLRVIATSSEPLQTLFAARDLKHPKYSEPWKQIVVTTCNDAEARELLQFLPPRSREIAIDHLPLIKRISRFAPQPLQCLCYRLFDGECDGLSDKELSTLIGKAASYK